MASDDLVNVATFATLVDAELAGARLEAEGITFSVEGDVLAGVTGGVRIYVREEDRERAAEVLAELQAETAAD